MMMMIVMMIMMMIVIVIVIENFDVHNDIIKVIEMLTKIMMDGDDNEW